MMPLTQEESHKLLVDMAEIRSDVKYIREYMVDTKLFNKDISDRVGSLETSRNYAKATLGTTWAVLLWLGWDWVQTFFRHTSH